MAFGNIVNGTDAADLLSGSGADDTVLGGQDDDTLSGGDGADALYGNLGDDVPFGGAGADTLAGGAGADRFALVAEGGADVVVDFNPDEGDRILVASGFTYGSGPPSNGDTVLTLAGGGSLTLKGFTGPLYAHYFVAG